MEAIFAVLRMAWNFFSDITCPFLGISFASLFLGVLIVNFTIRLLRPLLGIGSAFSRGSSDSSVRPNSHRYNRPVKQKPDNHSTSLMVRK